MSRSGSGEVENVVQYLDDVFAQIHLWERKKPAGAAGIHPWFRGEPSDVDEPLLPKVYRKRKPYGELELLWHFRNMAVLPNLGAGINREATDLWLYLAQHAGLETRLLDWSEGALTALFFAVAGRPPARVWMLWPQQLNSVSIGLTGFELSWHTPARTSAAIRAAWQEKEDLEPELPVALYPMHVHPRLQVQQSCFTIHGKQKEGLKTLMNAKFRPGSMLRAFEIDPKCHSAIVDELRILGISRASLFPDLDGLAADLNGQFGRRT
jgi:hypothetical protein